MLLNVFRFITQYLEKTSLIVFKQQTVNELTLIIYARFIDLRPWHDFEFWRESWAVVALLNPTVNTSDY